MRYRLALAVICLLFCGPSQVLVATAGAQTERKYKLEEDVVYARPEGAELRLDAFLPKTAGPHPAVLVIHGGAWRIGSKGQLRIFAIKLAEQGYATFAINYRLAPTHKFPAQIEDCRSAVRWIVESSKKYSVDPARVGAMGYSAGGHLAALMGVEGIPDLAVEKAEKPRPKEGQPTKDSSGEGSSAFRLKAVVAGGAPCDLRVLPPNSSVLEYWLGAKRADKPDLYKTASPIVHVTRAASPIFFFHGEADTLVSLNLFGPRRMVESLKAAGVATDLYVIPGAGHVLAMLHPTAFQRSLEFFDKHLKERVAEKK